MDVSVELTDAGVEHVTEVLQAIYRYIHVMRSVEGCDMP
jgi:secreted Zn-dependent insulinase-like peptidase